MSSRFGRLAPGNLMTRQERLQLRMLQEDLERQLARAADPSVRRRLERELSGVLMDRAEDKRTRPRRKK